MFTRNTISQVCDQPHPILVGNLISHCLSAELDGAYGIMKHLCDLGYSATDIITTLFRVVRNYTIAADMVLIYFINRPNPIALAEHGRINFLPFDKIPDTIVVNGFERFGWE